MVSFLNSFWRIPTIKSWISLKIVEFHIVTFSATEIGLDKLKNHPLNPLCHKVIICPTINSSFNNEDRERIIKLCVKYDPIKKKKNQPPWGGSLESLGYNGQGVLLAHSHGIPNNSPRLLYKNSKKWSALFKGRSALCVQNELPSAMEKIDEDKYFNIMKQKRLSLSKNISLMSESSKKIVLVMAALSNRPRSDNALSIRTGLSLKDIAEVINKLKFHEWINESRRLTDDGYSLLKELKKSVHKKKSVSFPDKPYYYPSSLRRPE